MWHKYLVMSVATFGVTVTLGNVCAQPVTLGDKLTISQLIEMARLSSRSIEIARLDQNVASAGVTIAKAYPNPEFELLPGRSQAGTGAALGVAQVIELPQLRQARLALARSQISLTEANLKMIEATVIDQVRRRAIDTNRAQEEQLAVKEDLTIAQQILDRVRVRVQTGEAPRFDLLRAQAEVEIVQKNFDSAMRKVKQSKIDLQQVVGAALPETFDVEVDSQLQAALLDSDYQVMRMAAVEQNPELTVARTAIERSTKVTELEQRTILPQFTVKLQHERDNTLSLTRLGVQVVVPLLNRRQGNIEEAIALSNRARGVLEARRFEIETSFASAWEAYVSAQAQVKAFESGILERSKAVLEIAQAAYRLGERGILEYLDAQRQFRAIRNDVVLARYNLLNARAQLERLSGR
jgi:outer membrane protein, heavy metal efflux system